ncbi:DnaJ family domain-containing protein [Celerinatantimonas yamalensis]|uniref:DnaJ family domain-containing protein n=1 Tax=Celerinatantimonas yamalensis TaxID=559956 RepID=A0ABW9G3R4_9GAMM
MILIDQLAERHIQQAIEQGQLNQLAGTGRPLKLDDDSHVPAELRAGYRVLKNAGFIPPELAERKEALRLCDLLKSTGLPDADPTTQHPIYQQLKKLELKMRVKGINTYAIQHYLHRFSVKTS